MDRALRACPSKYDKAYAQEQQTELYPQRHDHLYSHGAVMAFLRSCGSARQFDS